MYNSLAFDHLNKSNNTSTYAKVARMSAKTTEKKVNAVWKQIFATKSISTNVQKSFLSTNTDLPEFYNQIKTHKLQQGMEIRPIASIVRGSTWKISWLLSRLLKPLLKKVPAHLESSFKSICKIESRSTVYNREYPYEGVSFENPW